jgi:hypothetical protein
MPSAERPRLVTGRVANGRARPRATIRSGWQVVLDVGRMKRLVLGREDRRSAPGSPLF